MEVGYTQSEGGPRISESHDQNNSIWKKMRKISICHMQPIRGTTSAECCCVKTSLLCEKDDSLQQFQVHHQIWLEIMFHMRNSFMLPNVRTKLVFDALLDLALNDFLCLAWRNPKKNKFFHGRASSCPVCINHRQSISLKLSIAQPCLKMS